jgi:glyoxylase-like metal-dependent hydrolase (beta-lactamase superfamily II)
MFLLAPAAATAEASTPSEKSLQYGDVVRAAPKTLMVVGRPLDVAKGEADIANAILYRPRSTLYVIDTGATRSFRPSLRRAIERLRPFRRVVLINTHGHPDHIGNNALVTGLRARSVRHYMSRRDFAIADHYVRVSLGRGFRRVSGYLPGFEHPTAQAQALYKLFNPVEQSRSTRRAIESLPRKRIRIGDWRTHGWKFGHNDVDVIRTAAHTRGELIVYFPKIRLLHMGDELFYYQAWSESNNNRTRRVFVNAIKAAHDGAVRLLTSGHEFSVVHGARHIRRHMRSFIYGYDTYNQVVKGILAAASRSRPRCREPRADPTLAVHCSAPSWPSTSSSSWTLCRAAGRGRPAAFTCRRPKRKEGKDRAQRRRLGRRVRRAGRDRPAGPAAHGSNPEAGRHGRPCIGADRGADGVLPRRRVGPPARRAQRDRRARRRLTAQRHPRPASSRSARSRSPRVLMLATSSFGSPNRASSSSPTSLASSEATVARIERPAARASARRSTRARA